MLHGQFKSPDATLAIDTTPECGAASSPLVNDSLATATSLEAAIALEAWQRHRDRPQADRLAEYDQAAADAAYAAQLAAVDAVMNDRVPE